MKYSNYFLIAVLFLFIGTTANLTAQTRVITVAQGIGTLNDAIDGDTTAAGERIDPDNTVYELERGGYYLTNGIISNSGWTLRIRAAEGEGDRPVIMPAVIEGGESTYPFRPRGNFYISGLYITNMDQDGVLLDRPIRASADSMRIVVDDCHIDYAAQAAFRIDNKWNKIYVTNSIISNMGRMASPANGRGIDDRGNDIDTLVLENNTFYNLTMTVVRDGGGIINYCKVNQNTIVNVAQYGIHFGETIEAYFTNNVVINAGFLGSTDDRGAIGIGALGEDLINQGIEQIVVVDNNNFYLDPALIEALPDTVERVPTFDATTAALIEENSTGLNDIEEALEFTSGPSLPIDVIASHYDESISLEDKTDMDDGGAGPRAGQGVPVQLSFDFAYESSFQSYTASSTGEQLGALTWFGITVGVEDDGVSEIPNDFSLSNNYPNPFNPSTNIKYTLPSAGNVRLVVYNMLGEEVKTLVNTNQQKGSYSVTWDGKNNYGNKVSSGMYIYRLKADNFVASKKMILMK